MEIKPNSNKEEGNESTKTNERYIHEKKSKFDDDYKNPLSWRSRAIFSSSRSRGSRSRLRPQKCSPQSTESLKVLKLSSMKVRIGGSGARLKSCDCHRWISRIISAARCLFPKLMRLPGRTSLLPSLMKVKVVRYTPARPANVSQVRKLPKCIHSPIKGMPGGFVCASVAL